MWRSSISRFSLRLIRANHFCKYPTTFQKTRKSAEPRCARNSSVAGAPPPFPPPEAEEEQRHIFGEVNAVKVLVSIGFFKRCAEAPLLVFFGFNVKNVLNIFEPVSCYRNMFFRMSLMRLSKMLCRQNEAWKSWIRWCLEKRCPIFLAKLFAQFSL